MTLVHRSNILNTYLECSFCLETLNILLLPQGQVGKVTSISKVIKKVYAYKLFKLYLDVGVNSSVVREGVSET